MIRSPYEKWPDESASYAIPSGASLTQNARGLTEQARDVGVLSDLYSYDANGNVGSITDQQEGVITRNLEYDAVDRLGKVTA